MASVLYLTDTRYAQRAWLHPSARHRCYHYAEALLAGGGNSLVIPLELATRELIKNYENVVFHRPVWSKRFAHALKNCRDASVPMHADYDDLVFHPEFAKHSPMYINDGRTLAKVEQQFNSTHKAAKCFDSFLVSTSYLREKLQNIFSDSSVTVLPNSLPYSFVPPNIKKKQGGMQTIGYFPGSRGHGKDFMSVVPALKEVVNAGVRMLIVGRFDSDDCSDLENVVQIPFANYSVYLNILSHVDVSIAPLTDNVFNRSKSAVKLIESVAVGTNIVVSANQDMMDHNNQLTRLVSNTSDISGDWVSSLTDALHASSAMSVEDRHLQATTLANNYSVVSRMPRLLEHLQCLA